MERVVLITGAGSGIGLASALEAAQLGFVTVAAVHRPEQQDDVRAAAATAGVDLVTDVLDVTDEQRAREVIDRHRPWGLVNVAGALLVGLVTEVPPDEARAHLDLMVLAPARLTRLALPHMRRRDGGRIVNVSSVAGTATGPVLGWYEAAKAALGALSDAMRPELARWGVEVVLVEPGAYQTPIWAKARDQLEHRRATSLEPDVYDRAITLGDTVAANAGDPAEVADVVAAALHAGHPRFRYRVGPGSSGLATVSRVVPTSVKDRVTRAAGGL
ncbi:MAG TPA: SDR family NAD(P)-dependent oxidoreductase [Acidimicrobiales bacterium]